MTERRWVLFDLGGVLVDFSGPRDLPELLPSPVDADLRLRMADCAATDAFERGAITPEVFAERFVREWRLNLAPAEFLARYVQWLRGLYPGAAELLGRLRPQHRLACLSNTNIAHWEEAEPMRWLRRTFDVALSSHELKLRKPQPEIFAAALQRLGCAPADVVYFDDLAANVAAAQTAGFDAHHVDGFAALDVRIRQLGLIHD